MKKILKEIKILNKRYLRYRLIITRDIIELKLTPRSDSRDEINYVVKNDKYGRIGLLVSLQLLKDEKDL